MQKYTMYNYTYVLQKGRTVCAGAYLLDNTGSRRYVLYAHEIILLCNEANA